MNMKIEESKLAGLYRITLDHHNDVRGAFIKTFHADQFASWGLETRFTECYYSISHKNVLRGIHFQNPPSQHSKLVYCTRGRALDVLVDLRKESLTYGQCTSFDLIEDKPQAIYISPGFGHGFLALEDNTMLSYQTSTVYVPKDDAGIKWDSINFVWPIEEVILSERDKGFIDFSDFQSPF